jgi:succinate dehydrogenase hydrophobic anchor subunit
MSIKVLRLGTTGMKHIIGSYVREHGSEIAIAGIMTTVLVGIAALATGDIIQAFAHGAHH